MPECKPKHISSQDSFSSAVSTINNNFSKFEKCLLNLLSSQNQQNNGITLTTPDDPNPNIEYNLQYINGTYVLVEDTGGDGLSDKYWLVNGEKILIKERTQHIVKGQMILEPGSTIEIKPTGQLVVL